MIVVCTGASGVGKTTAVRALESRGLAGVRCFYFDSIGVPEDADEEWQTSSTVTWLARLDALGDGVRVAVLDGQVRPSVVVEAARRLKRSVQVVLFECERGDREARLRERGHPELACETMQSWAAYLRGQADALKMPVVDTTGLAVDEVADRLANEIRRITVEAPL